MGFLGSSFRKQFAPSLNSLKNRMDIVPFLNRISGGVAGFGLNRLNSDVVSYSNLVTNGDFSDGVDDIVTQNCTVAYSDGLLKVNATATLNRIAMPCTIEVGVKYFFRLSNFTFGDINNVDLFTITTGNGVAFVQTIETLTSPNKEKVYAVFTPTLSATHLRVNPNFTGSFGLDVDYSFSSADIIKMTGTRYENYTAEEMNAAFPFTPTTANAIVPQKPIRVYRDSDSAELDIGLIGNKLDTASLLSFAGVGSAYVVKVYDQTNNGNDAIQSVAANCPRIVNAGVLEVDSNGDVSVYYDGTNDRFDVTDNNGLDITSGGLSLVAKHDPDNATGYIISRNLILSTNVQYGLVSTPTGAINLYLNGIARSIDPTQLLAEKITISTYDDVNIKTYLDSTLKDTDAYSTALTSQPNIQIGCRSSAVDGSTKTIFYKGHISSIIIFNRAITQTEVNKLNRL